MQNPRIKIAVTSSVTQSKTAMWEFPTVCIGCLEKIQSHCFTKQCNFFKTSNVINRMSMSFVRFVNAVNITVTSAIKLSFRKQETGPTQ
jgi:hypothetical protein